MKKKVLRFPKGFLWGTATSAYQVEGGIKNDWSEKGGKFDAGIACDHYNRFEEDFDLAKKMNNNAHRFSISWARIEPEEGKFSQKEIEHYRKVILALRERGLEPFVTLYHWPLPIWLAKRGGWLNKKASEYFIKYAEFVVKNLPKVKFWITINEPWIYTPRAFLIGEFPPFRKNIFKTIRVLKNLSTVHNKAYQAIHRISPNASVGIASNNVFFSGILSLINYYRNIYFLDKIKDYQDFIGINYYSCRRFRLLKQAKPRPVSDLGWEIYPKGIYYALKNLKKYNKPIYITENGLADAKDKKRADFIINHLKWVHKAIEEDIDVRGYLHWSLIDNYEWGNFKPRFGLIEIDYETLRRIPRPSSKIYAEICKNNAIKL